MKENFYKELVEEFPVGYAYHKIICDNAGAPVDYLFIEVNAAFEEFTGLSCKDVTGKRATEIFSGLKMSKFDWLKIYGEIALTGGKREFEAYSEPLGQWYRLTVYSPQKGYFISLFQNISELVERNERVLEIEERYRSIFEYAPIGLTNISIDGRFLDVNSFFCRMLGYSRTELCSMGFTSITHSEDQNRSRDGMAKMMEGLIPVFKIEKRYIHKDGSIVWASVASSLLRDSDGRPLYFVNMVSDITEYKRQSEYKIYMDSLIKEMGSIAKIGGWEFDAESGKWSRTEEVFNILDIPPRLEQSMLVTEAYYTEESQSKIDKARKDAIKYGIPYDLELELTSAKGIRKWIRTIAKPVYENGRVVKLRGAFQDISDRKEIELALRKSESTYRLIAENAADVISVYNVTKEKFVYISPSVERLRGISIEEAMKESIEESVPAESFKPFSLAIANDLDDFLHNPKTANYYVNEVQQSCKDGGYIWVEISTKYQYNSDGDIEAVNIIRSIEERKKAEEEILELSYRDQLTGLYNRRYYEETKKREDVIENLPLALVMADVNGLKLTNDTCGHQAGDLLLQRIATVLKTSCSEEGIISRIGGDEFVILLPKAEEADVISFIHRIHSAMSEETKKNKMVSLSIGYAIKRSRQENINEVFKNAEDQMYQDKFSGDFKR